jgi:transcriptional antiterminator RfaH
MNLVTAADTVPGAWYVCYSKPRQEALAMDRLQSQGYEAFLPELARWVRHSRGWKRSTTALFPRYLFVRPSSAGQSIAPIRSTPGVSTLVRFGHQPARLPEAHLHALRQLLAQAAEASPEQPITPGMAVAFAEGPLKGLQGVVSSVADERVTVLFTLIGQPQQLEVGPHQLLAA